MDEYDLGYYDIGDEFVGDDVDEILGQYMEIGAKRKAMVRQHPGLAAAIAQKRAKDGMLLKDVVPTKPRQYAMPLDSVATIASLATANVTTRPQVLFRAERLVIDQNANSWLINDLRVGKNSQFVATGSQPGAAYAATAFGVRLKCDTAQISQDITLNVTNNSGGALRFVASLFGDAVE